MAASNPVSGSAKTRIGNRKWIAAIAAAIFILHPSSFILRSASAESLYTNVVVTTSPTRVLTNRFNRIIATVRPVTDGVLYYGDTASTNALSTVGMYIAGTNEWYTTKNPTQINGSIWMQAGAGSITCRVEDVWK